LPTWSLASRRANGPAPKTQPPILTQRLSVTQAE
jgi:hypothetical protein